jgi:hypothetical protein
VYNRFYQGEIAMENIQSEQVEVQTEVLPRRVWITPQFEAVEFVDTSAVATPGATYDFVFYANRSL